MTGFVQASPSGEGVPVGGSGSARSIELTGVGRGAASTGAGL